MPRHFLYLTNTRLVSLTSSGGRLVARREFAVEGQGEGTADFERHLRTLSDTPTHMITDLAEEDFRLDTIPHVSARDRDAIVARKLTQVFRATPYRHAILQGREAEGRRDDRVLYTAINNPDVLKPWIEAIERQRVPLAGIHSSAIFSGNLLVELGLGFPQALLVTFTPGGALRQTYFRNKEARFSRLTPIDLEEGQTLGAMLAEETTRTWQYLDSLRNFSAEDQLEVCVLVHPKDRPAIDTSLRDFAQIRYRLLDIEQVAAKLGLKPPPLGSSAEEILVHLFLRKPVGNHYAPPELRSNAVLRSARIALTQVSVAVLVAGVAWGGYTLSQILRGDREDQRTTQEMKKLNREYDEISRALPSANVGGTAMRDTVAFYNGNLRSFPSIVEFLTPLSSVLNAYPRVRLLQVSWLASNDPRAEPPMQSNAPRSPNAIRSVPKSGDAPPPPVAPPDPNADTFSGGMHQVALLEATVQFTGIDYRSALAEVDRLTNGIDRIPGYAVTIVESPLDTRPLRSIQGRVGERPAGPTEARFVLRVARDRSKAP
ncbi:hypothetical protein [Usitatibacter palustris]|uniref:Uncharacterized protein n=1 Tax=Usitatibacter palustris TaxID=2732487 RepID=A0A6M4HBE2_9PROT|nr:hypothetical protein [Usitatibacter palustris]QJR16395.1 hypothetical protein DSM104440_03229 [Usitatibacter palustris]